MVLELVSMLYLSLLINVIAIITFTVQIILTARSSALKLLKITMFLYFSTLLFWQLSALGIFLSKDVNNVAFFYRIYSLTSTGFIFFFLPLSFAIERHKRTTFTFFITLLFYLFNIIINLIHNPLKNLYLSEAGFYIPELDASVIFTNLFALIFFLGGIIHCIIALYKCTSAVSRQRLLYFLLSSVIIFSGLLFNLTPYRYYPVDLICAMIGGLLLAYAILAKKIISIRKSFFRGALNSTLLTGMTGIYLLFTYIYSTASGVDFPYFTILPVVVSYFIFLAVCLRRGHSTALSIYGRLHFAASSVYQRNFESYNMAIKNELDLKSIFQAYFNTADADFEIESMTVFLYDGIKDCFKYAYEFGSLESIPEKSIINRSGGIIDLFVQERIIILSNIDKERSIAVTEALSELPVDILPDIIQILRVADEPAGLICVKLNDEYKRFIDREDQEYLAGLNSITSDAIARAFAHEKLVIDVSHKENLIKDINHRVKNNLQMISGLLSMQEMTSDDEEVRAALQTARGRVETIAKVHELLYTGGVVEQIMISDYLNEIVNGLRMQLRAEREIKFITEVPEIMLETEKALTFCMVVNELMSNAIKYAFALHENGEIRLEVQILGNELSCLIQDNGSGLQPQAEKDKNSTGLGHNLVKTFIEKQLKGSWRVEGNSGTSHYISFPVKN